MYSSIKLFELFLGRYLVCLFVCNWVHPHRSDALRLSRTGVCGKVLNSGSATEVTGITSFIVSILSRNFPSGISLSSDIDNQTEMRLCYQRLWANVLESRSDANRTRCSNLGDSTSDRAAGTPFAVCGFSHARNIIDGAAGSFQNADKQSERVMWLTGCLL